MPFKLNQIQAGTTHRLLSLTSWLSPRIVALLSTKRTTIQVQHLDLLQPKYSTTNQMTLRATLGTFLLISQSTSYLEEQSHLITGWLTLTLLRPSMLISLNVTAKCTLVSKKLQSQLVLISLVKSLNLSLSSPTMQSKQLVTA
jgi:hypothetical protein